MCTFLPMLFRMADAFDHWLSKKWDFHIGRMMIMINRIAMHCWNLKAGLYHPIRSLPLLRNLLCKEIRNLKMLIEKVSFQSVPVLDVGTGIGSTLGIFPDRVQVIGLDHSYVMLRKSRKRENVIGVVGDGNHLPFQKCGFSFISAIGFTEYLSDTTLFLDEINRIIRPDGHFLVTIAPPGLFNFLRNLLGHRIYPIRTEDWEAMVTRRGFACVGNCSTWLQDQYLFSKKK
ncbi:class I SAM-dependent methyltransferase, partial [bacterium]|nr:class I SAM-dependent methyltransferase [bacterium]